MSWVNPPSPAVGAVATATMLDIYAADLALIWGASWVPYSVTWSVAAGGSAPSVGNGSLQGFYKVIGKMCAVRIYVTFGSTTSGGQGAWTFTLPFVAAVNVGQCLSVYAQPVGTAAPPALMAGVATFAPGSALTSPFLPQTTTATTLAPVQNLNNAGGAGSGVPAPTGGNPVPFSTNAYLLIFGIYETT